MRWIPWNIALIAAAFGGWILHEQENSRTILRVNRIFQDWLIELSGIPVYPPVPISLVDMEDTENWTALDYSLFLKALPKDKPPVVILESLPPEGNSAFHRAFNDLAIKQPNLILPVLLSTEGKIETASKWWLGGWKAKDPPASITKFRGIEKAPPEILRGTVMTGIVNLPDEGLKPGPRAGLYYLLGDEYVPSMVLRATLTLWKIPPTQVRVQAGITLSGRRLPGDTNGTMIVDTALLPGLRRVASSDLLLRLNNDSGLGTADAGISGELLQGVLVLGDLSEKGRIYSRAATGKLTRAEIIAAAIATICNGPVLASPGVKLNLLILIAAASIPSLLARFPKKFMWSALPVLASIYLIVSIWLATNYSIGVSLFMPVCVFFVGFSLNHLAKNLRLKI